MSELVGSAPAGQPAAEPGEGPRTRKPRVHLALELVAMRGKDVVGVRHLQEGGAAWVGNVTDALARVSLRELGGQPFIVGDVRSGAYAVEVPPRARARVHRADGVPRLLVGPAHVELLEGERAVVVLGAVYAAAIAISASMSEPSPVPLRAEPGAMERIHQRFLPPRSP
jgi:hypothetical protein